MLNLSRDDAKWVVGKVVGGASAVILFQTSIGSYLGLSEPTVHILVAVCVVIAFVSGTLGNSPLPGAKS